MNQKHNYFSFMIVPPGSNRSFSFRLTKWVVSGLCASAFIFVLIVGFSIYFTSKTTMELVEYKQLKKEMLEKEKEEDSFKVQMTELKDEIEALLEKEEELQSLIGETGKTKLKKKSLKKNKNQSKLFIKEFDKKISEHNSLGEMKEFLTARVSSLKESIAKHYQKVQHNKNRFAYTPSIWPVYGLIRSKFGWRRHPITGRRVYHKGIDIPSWLGAPVKAAADGIIKYSGWSGTFGYVVIIDHNFGYRTIYAHASQLLVRKGQFVKKGKVIAQVGSTGLSTGSHLHYEIRRWDKAVNPKPYLDLDMFTASTRIW